MNKFIIKLCKNAHKIATLYGREKPRHKSCFECTYRVQLLDLFVYCVLGFFDWFGWRLGDAGILELKMDFLESIFYTNHPL